MHARRTWLLTLVSTAAVVAAAQPLVASAEDPPDALPARAALQIEALAAAKASRTATQDKIDSTLLTASQLSLGRALPAGVRVGSPVPTDRSGRTSVEIRGRVTALLRGRVRALGGVVRFASPSGRVTRADVPLAAVQQLAALPEVDRVVSLAATSITANMRDPRARTGDLSKQQLSRQRERSLAAALAAARPAGGPAPSDTGTGRAVSEGDRAHGADLARARRHVSGIGVTVGVLSDGVDSLAASVASSNLPDDVQVLPGEAGVGDEGTAMLEIVHDLAPKARLAFATAGNGEQSFADNIRALRAAGADVIVDDVYYFDESPFQDGPVAQAVRAVSRDGALYVSAAGNEGNVDDRTSGNYEATFRPSTVKVGKFVGAVHDFDPGPGVQASDPTSAGSADTPAILQWADAAGKAADDYDLYAIDPAGNVVAFSNDVQDGNDTPFEGFYVPEADGPVHLVVVKYRGQSRYFQLSVLRGRFVADGATRAYSSPGVTRGHSTVPAAVSVAAVPAAAALPFPLEVGDPSNPTGPFPGRFGPGQLSERFTSDGPRRMFFSPTGVPLTPGDFTSTGGRLRLRPTVAAADGVSTSVPGFESFYGTSASAPHAAAIAALALSGDPGLRAGALREAMRRTAIDIERPGRDRDTGTGIVDALALLRAVGAHGQPFLRVDPPVVTGSGDGDVFLEPGESGTVALPVASVGDVGAAGVTVTLHSSTPGVVVAPAVRDYGRIATGRTERRSFEVTVPASVPLGSSLDLRATARFRGAYSPQTSVQHLVVGQPAAASVTATYSGPPIAVPDADETGASATVAIEGVGPVSAVTFSIDGTSCSTDEGSTSVGLDHTFVGDLAGTLTSPDGTTVTLFDHAGGEGNNLCKAVFTDAATRPIEAATPEDAPFTGSWLPQESLSTFLGGPGDGSWRFTAADTQPEDTGSVRAFSVRVRGFVQPPSS